MLNHSFDPVWTPPVGSPLVPSFSSGFCCETAVGTMRSWCASGGRRWMARGWADSEQLVSVSSCVWESMWWGGGGGEVLLSYTGFPCSILHSFSKCWPTAGTVVMVSSLLLQQRPLFSFSVMNCKLPVFSSSCPLSFHVSASQICLFIKFVGPRNLRNSSHFRFLVCYEVTWQTSAYRENFVTNMDL